MEIDDSIMKRCNYSRSSLVKGERKFSFMLTLTELHVAHLHTLKLKGWVWE